MLTKIIKIMTSKLLRNLLLSETFIAGGPKVNLVNEEKGADAQKKRRKPHQSQKPQRLSTAGQN